MSLAATKPMYPQLSRKNIMKIYMKDFIISSSNSKAGNRRRTTSFKVKGLRLETSLPPEQSCTFRLLRTQLHKKHNIDSSPASNSIRRISGETILLTHTRRHSNGSSLIVRRNLMIALLLGFRPRMAYTGLVVKLVQAKAP